MQNMTNLFQLSLLVVLALSLAGCGTSLQTADPPVRELLINFFATIRTTPDDEVRMEIGVSGAEVVPADDAFNGLWELWDMDGNLRASGSVTRQPELYGGQEHVMVEWQSSLLPGSYELTWGAPNYGGMTMIFDVLSHGGRIQIGEQQIFMTATYPPGR
jgi:hypothetical protein